MSLTAYRRDLQARKQELVRLLNQRQKIDREIARLQPVINYLEGLCHELGNRAAKETAAKAALTSGLTDLARKTLEEAFGPLSTSELKLLMEKKGFDFSRYSNPLSSIHVVLQRLVKAGQVRVVPQKGGKKVYQWITTVDKLLSVLDTMTKVAQASKAGVGETAKPANAPTRG